MRRRMTCPRQWARLFIPSFRDARSADPESGDYGAKFRVHRSAMPRNEGGRKQKASNQILLGDDFAKPRIVDEKFLNELMHAVLEDVVHMAVFEPVADAAGVTLRRPLAAI